MACVVPLAPICTLARWLSDDPIGLRGGVNLTSYVYNSPLRMTDPLGVDAWSCQVPAKGDPKGPGDRKWGPDVPGNPMYHQYLCVTGADGKPVCGGKRPKTPAIDPNAWYESEPSEDHYNPAQCDRLSTKAPCFERCLREKVSPANSRGDVECLYVRTVRTGLEIRFGLA